MELLWGTQVRVGLVLSFELRMGRCWELSRWVSLSLQASLPSALLSLKALSIALAWAGRLPGLWETRWLPFNPFLMMRFLGCWMLDGKM
ncbi:hypothetical protein GIB67_014740 [Kingdonia uniflora]|uniref:Uncharacterized protein n=1 Tax=Kingdonia uniflora TaxID=39325 RepID=A0A7J7NUZ6_9MAGN|nr:hypothetical protein GIB67_014740 [Kingdonia uniflora]